MAESMVALARRLLMESQYLVPGRLQDVLALIQVLGLHPSARRSEQQLCEILQSAPSCGLIRWSDVALRHAEFFRVNGKNQDSVCLAARHAAGDADEERLLKPEFVEGLLRLAVDIHDRQAKMADRALRYLPLVIAIIGFVGSVTTALIALIVSKV